MGTDGGDRRRGVGTEDVDERTWRKDSGRDTWVADHCTVVGLTRWRLDLNNVLVTNLPTNLVH